MPIARRAPEPFHRTRLGRTVLGAFGLGWLVTALVLGLALFNHGARAVTPFELPLEASVAMAVLLVGEPLVVLGLVRYLTRRRKAKWVRAQSARLSDLRSRTELQPIAALPDGSLVRFAGAVQSVDHSVVAEHGADDYRESKAFCIADDSGKAWFDDDYFELWDSDGRPGAVVLTDGDRVEVIGQGSLRSAISEDCQNDEPSFYLEGSARSPIHLRKR